MSVGWGQDCDENMFWTDCGLPFECNPTCSNPNPPPDCFTLCEIGCFCNEGYVFSDDSFNECVLIENCPEQSLCDEGYVELWGECYNIEETTEIHIFDSGLTGEIPPEIGDLINLEWLYLYGNQLVGEIPDSICNLVENDCFIGIYKNQLCPPYPECIEDYVGEQDTSECSEPDPQIGDECVTQDGWIGFYDCELCCWDEWIIENWLGDDWCDYLGGCGFEGPLFNCPELGYDCGDCTEDWDGTDPSGLCSDDCLFPGDVNNDSILNILDIVSMITLILDGEYDECGDVNSDGDLNILDVITFVNIILSIP